MIEFRSFRSELTIASSKEKSPKSLEALRILSLVPVTGHDYTLVSASSSRRRWTVHRTVQFDGFGSSTIPRKQIPGSGICFLGAGDRTRTGTLSPAVDFESTTSTIPSHRRSCLYSIVHFCAKCKKNFSSRRILFWRWIDFYVSL